MSHSSALPDDFGGTVRLFPLPNMVLFPNVSQPLHIFETRYRQMMADALEDDRLLTMGLLRSGWEEDYHKKPPIHPMVCIGRIRQETQLPDGRYNLLLHGLARARVREEVVTPKLYRIARVEICYDEPPIPSREKVLRKDLGARVRPYFSGQPAAIHQLQELLDSPLELGALCDIFCFALPLEVEWKQELLDLVCVESRVLRLLQRLEKSASAGNDQAKRQFPPGFSAN